MGKFDSFYDEQRVVSREVYFQLASVYGLSALRDIQSTTAGASITATGDGEFKLSPGGASENATLDTAERVPYGPGFSAEPGAGIRLGQKLTGNQVARYGFYDDNNGRFWELDAEGAFTVIRRAGSDTRTKWGSWDGDRIKKDGVLKRVAGSFSYYEPLEGYIHILPFSWYGYGPGDFNVQKIKKSLNRWIAGMGRFRPSRQTSLQTPHLPIRAEAITGAGDASFDLFVAGRQASVVGEYSPPVRSTPISRDSTTVATTTNSTWTGMIAVRRVIGNEYALTRLRELDLLPVEDVEVALLLNPTIPNGSNWAGGISDIPAGETLIEENLNPGDIDISTAEWLSKFRILGGAGGQRTGGGNRDLLSLPLIENKPLVIAARGISAGGTAQITAVVDELW